MVELEFSEIIRRLKAFSFPKFDFVVGIGRGGMVPAVLVAYQLEKEVGFVHLNYRDEKNQPCRAKPALLKSLDLPTGTKKILLVDDVAVSGQTLAAAKGLFQDYTVKTFVFKGHADLVLFPEIQDCVNWPWKTPDR